MGARSGDAVGTGRRTVLVVGATGSVGRLVVAEALRQGHAVRALVRNPGRARLPSEAQVVDADVTRPETLSAAVDGVDAVVFTHASTGVRDIANLPLEGEPKQVRDDLNALP
jgi:uncharacterized protein YbjT (DUF2867 family)